jgi:hypothetical protein
MKKLIYKKFFLTIFMVACLLLSPFFALAEEYKFEPSYNVGGIKVKEPKAESLNIATARLGGEAGQGGTCNNVGNALAAMGINLNEDSLNKVVKNWSGMALPLALYFMATYTPIVKEAVIGAKSMSQMVAQLGNASCESMMKSIDRMNLQDSSLVESCMAKQLGDRTGKDGEDKWKGKSSAEITKVYEHCLDPKNVNILDIFGKDADAEGKVKTFVSFLDPQSYVKCLMFNNGIMVDPDTATLKDLQGEMKLKDGKLKAEGLPFENRLAILGTGLIPSFSVDASSGDFKATTTKIEGKDLNIIYYAKQFKEDIKKTVVPDVITHIQKALDKAIQGSATQDITATLTEVKDAIEGKYNIDITNVLLILEFTARWDQEMKALLKPTQKELICKQKLDVVKKEDLPNLLSKKALEALGTGLQSKFAEILGAAQRAASIGSGYNCKIPSTDKDSSSEKKEEAKKVTKDTVTLLEKEKDRILRELNEEILRLGSPDPCEAIRNNLADCLNNGIDGRIERYNALWEFDKTCRVIKVAYSGGAEFTATPEKKEGPKLGDTPKSLFFNMNSFRILAVILMMIAAIYLGKILIQNIPKEEWGVVALNGGAIILILSLMYSLVFRR